MLLINSTMSAAEALLSGLYTITSCKSFKMFRLWLNFRNPIFWAMASPKESLSLAAPNRPARAESWQDMDAKSSTVGGPSTDTISEIWSMEPRSKLSRIESLSTSS